MATTYQTSQQDEQSDYENPSSSKSSSSLDSANLKKSSKTQTSSEAAEVPEIKGTTHTSANGSVETSTGLPDENHTSMNSPSHGTEGKGESAETGESGEEAYGTESEYENVAGWVAPSVGESNDENEMLIEASFANNEGRQELWTIIASLAASVIPKIAKRVVPGLVKRGKKFLRLETGEEKMTEADLETLQQQLDALEGGNEGGQEFWGGFKKLLKKVKPFVMAGAKKLLETGEEKMTEANLETLQHQLNALEVVMEVGDEDGQEFWEGFKKLLKKVKPFVIAGAKTFLETEEQEKTNGVDLETLQKQLDALEVVIENDDRVRITPTKDIPWKRICHLKIQTNTGKTYLGTGFFVGTKTIITAGHCVYIDSQGGWAKSIVVTPGRNETETPFGTFTATKFRSVKGWVEDKNRDYDYGAILLDNSAAVSPEIGAFGFGDYSNVILSNKHLSTAGYPGDKPSGTMWFNGRKAKSITNSTIVYDTDTAGGQSGSPVWFKGVDDKRTVVGIHTNGASTGNSATRINKPVFENIKKWRTEGETTL